METGVDKITGQLGTKLADFEGLENGRAIGGSATKSGTTDFASALTSTGNEFAQTLQKAEAVSIAGINGNANAYEVASSVMDAEQSLRMAISVRDKIVAAYLEISRMQI